MLDKRVVVLSKDESTYNTDAAPVGTDAVFSEDTSWAFASQRMYQRNPVRSSLALLKPNYAGALISIKGKTEIKGSGAAGTAPEIGGILKGCGFAETVVGGVSVTYKPSSSQTVHKSETMWFYDDGLLIKVTGARGKATFDLSVGKAPMCAWDFTGHFTSITDAALVSATYDSTVPAMLVNVPFTIGAYAAIISKLQFDMGNTIAIPESLLASDGYGEVQITGRKLTGSFDPLRVTVATKNFITTDWQANTALALDTGVIGATAGNRLQVTMPAVTYTDVGRGNRSDVGTYEIKFQAAESASGDDEVSLVFT